LADGRFCCCSVLPCYTTLHHYYRILPLYLLPYYNKTSSIALYASASCGDSIYHDSYVRKRVRVRLRCNAKAWRHRWHHRTCGTPPHAMLLFSPRGANDTRTTAAATTSKSISLPFAVLFAVTLYLYVLPGTSLENISADKAGICAVPPP